MVYCYCQSVLHTVHLKRAAVEHLVTFLELLTLSTELNLLVNILAVVSFAPAGVFLPLEARSVVC